MELARHIWQTLNENLRRVSLIATVVLGAAWLLFEHALRGANEQIELWANWLISLTIICAIFGLAIRPRCSIKGEWYVAAEIGKILLFSIFFLPACMFMYYVLAIMVSLLFYGGSWLVWLLVLVVCVIAQFAVWAGLIGGVVFGIASASQDNVDLVGVGIALFAGGAMVVFVAHALTGVSVPSILAGGLAEWAYENQSWIKSWNFVFELGRSVLANVDHGRALSMVVSTIGGFITGAGMAVSLRLIRQSLMELQQIRLYMPLASAPLHDQAAVLPMRAKVPCLVYGTVIWILLAFLVLG